MAHYYVKLLFPRESGIPDPISHFEAETSEEAAIEMERFKARYKSLGKFAYGIQWTNEKEYCGYVHENQMRAAEEQIEYRPRKRFRKLDFGTSD